MKIIKTNKTILAYIFRTFKSRKIPIKHAFNGRFKGATFAFFIARHFTFQLLKCKITKYENKQTILKLFLALHYHNKHVLMAKCKRKPVLFNVCLILLINFFFFICSLLSVYLLQIQNPTNDREGTNKKYEPKKR